MKREKLFEMLDRERGLQEYWDAKPKNERALSDAEKPVEFWTQCMEVCLDNARREAYKGTDKTEALKKVYEAVALGLACLEHNDIPAEFFGERYEPKK